MVAGHWPSISRSSAGNAPRSESSCCSSSDCSNSAITSVRAVLARRTSSTPAGVAAITTARPFVAVHPQAAPHARVSWSMQALRQVDRLFLLIAGQRKLEVLQQAAAAEQNNAISKLANDKGVRLDVYWCA